MTVELVGVTIGVGAEHEALAGQAAERMRRLAGINVRILGPEELRRTGVSDPNHLKFRLFDLVDAENILYFDADAFCLRPWDPRVWLNRPEWLGIRGFWFDARVRRLGELFGFGDETFNGGLFLINRRHHQTVLHLAQAMQPADNVFPGLTNPDEIAFSSALAALKVPIRFLDRRFNWIQFGRGDLARHANVVVAHACHSTLRPAYACGSPFHDVTGRAPEDGAVVPEFSDAVYIYDRFGHDVRPLHFRSDGTIGDGGGDAERYHLGVRRNGQSDLVIGSVLDGTCRLSPGADRIWRGRWSHHEQMPVTLVRHRAQVLIDLVTRAGRRDAPLMGVEVGVDRGETSAILLRCLPRLHLYMVDSWRETLSRDAGGSRREGTPEAMEHAAQATAFARDRRTLVACDSAAAAAGLPSDLDLVFIDGDHSAGGVLRDLCAWWPKLAPGGLLSGHDYENPNCPGVKQAVDAFAAQHGLSVSTAPDRVWHCACRMTRERPALEV